MLRSDQSSMIHLNQERVLQLSESLKQISIAPDLAEQLAPKIQSDPETQLRAFLYAAAICHATKGGLKGTFHGKACKGWDYLYNTFRCIAENEPENLRPEVITQINEQTLRHYLEHYATNPEVQLTDLNRRAEILRILAQQLIHLFNGETLKIIEASQNLVGGEHGAYAQLAQLSAFQDPLQKKSSVFLMLAEGSRLITINDQENIMPMIDYHVIREFLRMGCIEVEDQALRTSLLTKEPADPTIEAQMREYCIKIITSLIKDTGRSVMEVDNLLWSHARSYCRHAPVCVAGNQPENTSFNEFTATSFRGNCPFQAWCPGAQTTEYRDLWEPMTGTENY